MKKRYYVEACDNGNSLGVPGVDPDAPPRSVTWLVCDRAKPERDRASDPVSEHYTRKAARDEAASLNANIPQQIEEFYCEGCREWLVEGGTVHSDGDHEGAQQTRHYRYSYDGGITWESEPREGAQS